MSKKAIVVGGSGLIGGELIKILTATNEYQEIVLISRKKIHRVSNYKIHQEIIDFDKLSEHEDLIKGDVLFCCLGSTRKKTPDLTVYTKIDHDYPVQLAQLALKNNVTQYHYVSALGADAGSSNFYTKMKGETERDLKKVGLKGLFIYQPSLLTGNRKEKRIVEKIAIPIMKVVNLFLIGGLNKYRSIPAERVARVMVRKSLKDKEGIHIYPSDKIK